MFKTNLFRAMIFMATLTLLAIPLDAIKAAAPIVVTPGALQGWLLFNDGAATTPPNSFVNGPGTPPLGIGSFHTAVTTNNSKFVLGRSDALYNNVPLSTLTQLSYSTYLNFASTAVNWYINIYLNSTGGPPPYDYRLDFAPPGSTTGVWQTWDAMTQPYWRLFNKSANTYTGTGTLATVTAGLPATTNIIQGFGGGYPSIKFGTGDSASGYVGFDANIDNITIGFSGSGSTTWDLELALPTPTPTPTNTPTPTPTKTPTPTPTFTPTPNPQAPAPTIAKFADKTLVLPGETVTFTITVTNNSSAPVGNVVVTDPINDPLLLISAAASQGAFAINANSVTFTIGLVNPAQMVSLTVVTKVRTDVKPPHDVINTATLNNTGKIASVSVHITAGGLPGTGEHPRDDLSIAPISILVLAIALALIGGLWRVVRLPNWRSSEG